MPTETIYCEHEEAVPILQELADTISHKIIMSTINAKSAQQIVSENRLPLSSTYKKIRKLCDMKLLCIDKIQIDRSGKKVLFYKSKIRSCQFSLRQEGATLQFERNEAPSTMHRTRTDGTRWIDSPERESKQVLNIRLA